MMHDAPPLRLGEGRGARRGQARRGHAHGRSVSLIHLQRSATEAHHITCSQSGIVADESRKPIERVPVHCRRQSTAAVKQTEVEAWIRAGGNQPCGTSGAEQPRRA